MQNRISEMDDEDVDYLRFDRIKIQRKRMEHILEVIKDLSFKNKQLFKENAALKQQRMHESHYEKLYRELSTERTILVEKNLQMSFQLEKYRETVLHQESLINSLKKELYGENISLYRSNFYDKVRDELQNLGNEQIMTEEYKILEAQYEDLKREYSKLYRKINSNQNSIQKQRFGKEIENSKSLHPQYKYRQSSPIKLAPSQCHPFNCQQESQLVIRTREKYEKCKRAKKQLSNEIKILREALSNIEIRQKRHVELIEVLKEKKTKICLCHVNKLKKKLSQTMFQIADISPQRILNN